MTHSWTSEVNGNSNPVLKKIGIQLSQKKLLILRVKNTSFDRVRVTMESKRETKNTLSIDKR